MTQYINENPGMFIVLVVLAVAALSTIGHKIVETYPHLVKTEHDPAGFEHHDDHNEPEPTGAFDWFVSVMSRKLAE